MPEETVNQFVRRKMDEAAAARREYNRLHPVPELPSELLELFTYSSVTEAEARNMVDQVPEPLILHCPVCGKQHLDVLEDGVDWSKRPHKTHLCKNTPEGSDTGCGHLWRPKETPTIGVASLG